MATGERGPTPNLVASHVDMEPEHGPVPVTAPPLQTEVSCVFKLMDRGHRLKPCSSLVKNAIVLQQVLNVCRFFFSCYFGKYVFKKTSISVVVHILLQTFIGYYGNIDTEVPSRTIINTNINICSLEKY